MDFKGALLKEISSSSSLRLNPTQPGPKIKLEQLSSLSSSPNLRDSSKKLKSKQHGPKIELQPSSSSSILLDSLTKLNPRQPKPEIKVHKISSQHVPKIKVQQSSSFSILQDTSMEKNNYRDWLDLPVELMESIMQRIGWYDVLMSAKNVCKTWHKICKGLSEWQVIEIRQVRVSNNVQIGEEWGYLEKVSIFFGEHAIEIEFICGINETVELKCGIEGVELGMKLAMHVIDLSSGELLDLCIHGFGCNHLLEYISHRSSQLRRLRLQFCDVYSDDYSDDSFKPKPPRLHISNKGLIEMLRHLPLLEELQFPHTSIPTECIEVAGRCCPHLKSFTLNEKECYYWDRPLTNNAHALAIVRNMPKLRHLQLFGNRMTDRGLKAILNHCHFLEYLDLRECYFLYDALEEAKIPRNLRRRNLARELRQKIKLVRFPLDSTEDYEFKAEISDFYDYW